jgi:CrcB protein
VAAILSIVVVAICGAIGAVARFWLSGAVGQRIGETFPWGTLVVNVTGAGAIGALAAAFPTSNFGASPSLLWLASATGFLGGYTTVSSFSLQTMSLMRVREWPSAFANIVASVVLCLSAAAVGFIAVHLAVRG